MEPILASYVRACPRTSQSDRHTAPYGPPCDHASCARSADICCSASLAARKLAAWRGLFRWLCVRDSRTQSRIWASTVGLSETETVESQPWISVGNSPCVELTRTAQAPRAAFLFARLSSGPRPCRWCGRTRPESPRTQPESCRLPAAFSDVASPFRSSFSGRPPLLPHFRSWALLWALPLATPPMRAISAAVIGL